ncbi:flavin-containing monooxygenase [Gordonia crocea]|uniref:Putative monooxygenase n=1 Tax=Gordonia crocea TaxID=589162 RepID=A0A7M3SVH1_9ACTN|nr:NAD(P)/FAD-dependent oxidoreductase [Gordonia crocea]GED96645.1 putative monooxygenase [Gordonia crocea]
MTEPDHLVAIIGAGPGGICASVLLQEKGINDFVIVDQAHDFGGSWRDNHYPGLGVDVPGFTYQYSFARNPEWRRMFPMGKQVWEYHCTVARRYGLYEHARWGTRVVKEEWDSDAGYWRLHVADGSQITARFVISAVGAYILAKEDPGIEGYRDFAGKVLRPNDWDHDYDLRDKRVAVIGTGASSVQITPSIAPDVQALEVFQRTAVWALPKPDFALPRPVGKAMASSPVGAGLGGIANLVVEGALRLVYQTPRPLFRLAAPLFDSISRALYRSYLRVIVRDADTRRRLMPDYGPLGKRPTLSNRFLQAFNRRNVSLVDTPIERIDAEGIWTTDGVHHRFDAIVLATGYHLFSDPESYVEGTVVGRDGFDLGIFYNEQRLQAYQSVSVPKLPNRWMLVGPYSWIGTGWHELVEISSSHAVNVIAAAVGRGEDVVEVSQQAHDEYHAMIRRNDENIDYYFNTVNAGLRTYYVNSAGDMPYIRPTSLFTARKQSRDVDLSAYTFRRVSETETDRPQKPRQRRRAAAAGK